MEYELIKMLQQVQDRYFKVHDQLTDLRGTHRAVVNSEVQLRQENKALRDQINILSRQIEQEMGRACPT